jgi:hypothetical protein
MVRDRSRALYGQDNVSTARLSKDRDSGDSIGMLMLQCELRTVGQGNACHGRL